MRGRWIAYAGLSCAVGSLVLHQTLGFVPGLLLAAAAALLGKIGLDSKGRSVALVTLLIGIVLIGTYLTVLILGDENIGLPPS